MGYSPSPSCTGDFDLERTGFFASSSKVGGKRPAFFGLKCLRRLGNPTLFTGGRMGKFKGRRLMSPPEFLL